MGIPAVTLSQSYGALWWVKNVTQSQYIHKMTICCKSISHNSEAKLARHVRSQSALIKSQFFSQLAKYTFSTCLWRQSKARSSQRKLMSAHLPKSGMNMPRQTATLVYNVTVHNFSRFHFVSSHKSAVNKFKIWQQSSSSIILSQINCITLQFEMKRTN